MNTLQKYQRFIKKVPSIEDVIRDMGAEGIDSYLTGDLRIVYSRCTSRTSDGESISRGEGQRTSDNRKLVEITTKSGSQTNYSKQLFMRTRTTRKLISSSYAMMHSIPRSLDSRWHGSSPRSKVVPSF